MGLKDDIKKMNDNLSSELKNSGMTDDYKELTGVVWWWESRYIKGLIKRIYKLFRK